MQSELVALVRHAVRINVRLLLGGRDIVERKNARNSVVVRVRTRSDTDTHSSRQVQRHRMLRPSSLHCGAFVTLLIYCQFLTFSTRFSHSQFVTSRTCTAPAPFTTTGLQVTCCCKHSPARSSFQLSQLFTLPFNCRNCSLFLSIVAIVQTSPS